MDAFKNIDPMVIVGVSVMAVILVIGIYYMMSGPKGTLYPGNNGTVSGDTYCAGNWGGVGGQNKNMKCTDQFDASTGEKLDCKQSYATHAGLRPTNVFCT
jgi:hypothetical protein